MFNVFIKFSDKYETYIQHFIHYNMFNVFINFSICKFYKYIKHILMMNMSFRMSLKIETDKYIIFVSASNMSKKITIYDRNTLEEINNPKIVEYVKNIRIGDLL